jgi:hypothetical protein
MTRYYLNLLRKVYKLFTPFVIEELQRFDLDVKNEYLFYNMDIVVNTRKKSYEKVLKLLLISS